MTTELKTFHTASASQIKTWRDCHRKWWFDKILGLGQPTTQAMDFGTKVHAQLEDYVNGKIEIHQMMPQAVELLQYIPPADKYNRVTEAHLTIEKGNGWPVNVTGKIDLLAQDKENPGHVKVIDYKTTKNFAYVPEVEALRRDPQRLIYTEMVLHFEKAAQYVTFSLLYTLKSFDGNTSSRVVSVPMQRGNEAFRRELLDLKGDLHLMVADSLQKTPEAVEANYDSCGNYGGCPFKERCPGCPSAVDKSGVEGIMGLFDQAQTAPTPQPAPAPQPAQAPQTAPAPQPAPALNPPAHSEPAAQSPLLAVNPQAGQAPAPQATQPAPAPQAEAEKPKEEKPKRKRRTKDEIRRDKLIEQCNGDATKLNAEEYGELAYLLKNNPLENFTLGAAPAATVAPPATTPAPTTAPAPATPAPTAPAPTPAQVAPEQHAPVAGVETLRLFVNCRPAGKPVKELNTILTPVFRKVEQDNNVSYWTQVEYGKGVDAVCGMIGLLYTDQYANDRKAIGLYGDVYVDGRDPSFAKIVNALKRFAAETIEAA